MRLDRPNTGTALHASAPRGSGSRVTGHQSSRPVCEARFTDSFAAIVAVVRLSFRPCNCDSRGKTNRRATTKALTGFPGKPITGFPLHTPRIVGFPGLMLTPWTRTPGSPSAWIVVAVRSRTLAEDPAVITTASHFFRA